MEPEHTRTSEPAGSAPALHIEREHLPDGRVITYYSRPEEAELGDSRPAPEPT